MFAALLLLGLLLWTAGTVVIRLGGQLVLRPHAILPVYLASFALAAVVVAFVCRRLAMRRDSAIRAITLVMLPTLILDPFSCLFFSTLFPNLDPALAGAFGGWMLIFCGGAVVGAWSTR